MLLLLCCAVSIDCVVAACFSVLVVVVCISNQGFPFLCSTLPLSGSLSIWLGQLFKLVSVFSTSHPTNSSLWHSIKVLLQSLVSRAWIAVSTRQRQRESHRQNRVDCSGTVSKYTYCIFMVKSFLCVSLIEMVKARADTLIDEVSDKRKLICMGGKVMDYI